MLNVIVTIDVRPDMIDAFLRLAIHHRDCSRREPGCRRFDLSRRGNRFLLCEAFTDCAALALHRQTLHYHRWQAEITSLEAWPRTHEEFEEVNERPDAQRKIVNAEIVLKRLAERPACRTVFTNGVFDLLGAHHVHHLQQSKAAGDVLIVGLNSDESTRRLKGQDRPIQPVEDRAAMLANLATVDFVIVFHEDTPAELIRQLRPTVLTKDEGYHGQSIPGQEWVGQVIFTKRLNGYSTTALIEEIRRTG